MLVYYQWKPFIDEIVEGMVAAGQEALLFTPNGPPGAFALYLPPGMRLGPIFLNEFVCVSANILIPWSAQHLIFVSSPSVSRLSSGRQVIPRIW
jgi:hypothetical protein